ncbi:FMN-dependent NADH-azoreductase [Pedobacter sp. AW1-32]|uniref:FMN-dependent NADH-azoreductase n=1 Tax=Pedobacter sp. AW1-32 TaxID=3383026 RepID=UPI003FEF85B2
MKRILHLISTIQGAQSYSLKLGNAIVEKIVAQYPGSTVVEVDLNTLDLPHLNPKILQSMFTPADQLTDETRASLAYSNFAVQQLLDTDILVIGAPLYNLTIPSTLKSWADHVTRAGITFGYSEKGPVGKVLGKKVYVAMSSGGIYSEGPTKENDFVAPFLRAFLGLLGMTDVSVFRAEGVKVPGFMENALQKGIDSIYID